MSDDTTIKVADPGTPAYAFLEKFEKLLEEFSGKIELEDLLNILFTKIIVIGCANFGPEITKQSLGQLMEGIDHVWQTHLDMLQKERSGPLQ